MANKFHKDLTGADVHTALAYTYANAAARTGATGFVLADVGKLALQSDTVEFYILKTTAPAWTKIDSFGAVAVGPASSVDNALTRFDGVTGKLLQNSLAILDDSAYLTLANHFKVHVNSNISSINLNPIGSLLFDSEVTQGYVNGSIAISGAPLLTGAAIILHGAAGGDQQVTEFWNSGVFTGRISPNGEWIHGSPAAVSTTHGFYKDLLAGDTSAFVYLEIGNKTGSQGKGSIGYQNDAATGSPVFDINFNPRNNANSGAVAGGHIRFRKTPGNDSTTIFFATANTSGTPTLALTLTEAQNVEVAGGKEIRFTDLIGGQYVGFRSPDTVTGTTTYILPPAPPASTKYLASDSSSNLSWEDAVINGSNNQFIYKNSSGVVEGLPFWFRNTSFGGYNAGIDIAPSNVGGGPINQVNLSTRPTANAPTDSFSLHVQNVFSDVDSSGFEQGTGGNFVRFDNNYFEHNGTGNIGEVNFLQSSFSIGNGTDAIDLRGLTYAYGQGIINANVTVTANINGYGFNPNGHASVTITPGANINAFFDAANFAGEARGYTSFSANPNLGSIATNSNYQGYVVSPAIGAFDGNAGFFGVSVFGNLGTFDTGGFAGFSCNPNIAFVKTYADGINITMDNVTLYAGAQSSIIEQDLTITYNTPGDNDYLQLQYVDSVTAGSEVASVAGNILTVQIDSGASTASQVKAALEANFTINGAFTIVISGVGSNPQVTTGPANLSGGENPGQKRAAYLDGNVEITGSLTFGGALSIASLSAFTTGPLIAGTGNPASGHTMITQPTVADNVTVVNADYLGVNTAMLLQVGANATVTTSFVGVAALGLPAVLTMKTGSTIDRVSAALFAVSLDAGGTGGTIDELSLCRALALPNGVTAVNEMKAFKFDLPFGNPATETWGVYMEPVCENFMAGSLKIGGSDTVANASVGLEVDSVTRAIRVSRMTTTERNALTALDGMIVFNTTTNKYQGYASASWQDLN